MQESEDDEQERYIRNLIREQEKRNGGLSVESRNCGTCVNFERKSDEKTGICREYECCVNENQCCAWYVRKVSNK